MSRNLGAAAVFVLYIGSLWFEPVILAQQAKVATTPGAGSALSTDKALTLAEQGHCQESISALKHAMSGRLLAETRKRAGILGLRCSLTLDNRDMALDFLRLLGKQFAQDPDVLFILVHAYSDLSTRTAQDLGRTAPQSIAAHKLNAEALEMQGMWLSPDFPRPQSSIPISRKPTWAGGFVLSPSRNTKTPFRLCAWPSV